MDKTDQQGYQSLLDALDSESKAESLDKLLSAVRKQKRTRILKRSFGIAAILCLGSVAITFNSKPSEIEKPHYAETKVAGNWSVAESEIQFTEIQVDSHYAFEPIETSVYGPTQTVDEKGLIDLFKDRPIMISHATEGSPRRFWVLEGDALQ